MTLEPYKICPNCKAYRAVNELLCGNIVNGRMCEWSLYQEEIHDPSGLDRLPSNEPDKETIAPICKNGHSCSPGDLFCPICNEELGEDPAKKPSEVVPEKISGGPEGAQAVRRIGNWLVLEENLTSFHNQHQFIVTREGESSRSILILYRSGSEPDSGVYNTIRKFSRDHVPELKETGHWEGQAFEVWEFLSEGNVRDFPIDAGDINRVEEFVSEVGRVLGDFSEAGLRHRDIRPETIQIRTRVPLDLVVTGFGSARLSDLDLEIATPLETGRYTAPETMMGGVSAASDWWGLGMILLDKLTNGECFAGAEDQLFMIHVIAHGVLIPEVLPPRISSLLRGLLAVDRMERWQWGQVQSWLQGVEVPVPAPRKAETASSTGPSIQLGGRDFHDAVQFTLAAARAANWDEACNLLELGTIGGWAREINIESRTLSALEQLSSRADVSPDFRLGLALQLLNPAMPLIYKESIISPAWLLQVPSRGFELLSGPVPGLLIRFGIQSQAWLLQLATRSEAVSRKAESLAIQLDAERFQLCSVISSRAHLTALWDERRSLFSDANVPGLCSIMDRRSLNEEDLVLLSSASLGLFRSTQEVIEATIELARTQSLEPPGEEILQDLTRHSRLRLYELVESRTEGFARCNQPVIDDWLDGFRIRRRLDIEQLLIVLSIPESSWKKLPYQEYLASLLSYFEKKVSASVLRGPLVKMAIGKTTPRIDVAELAVGPNEAKNLLERLLDRSDRQCIIPTDVFNKEPNPELRLRRLESHTATYRRDTGVNGLYLGFPFLVLNDQPGRRQPRLAPVLLWPILLKSSVGQQGSFSLAFDRDREEVRLNPAFEGLLGLAMATQWRDAANELLIQDSIRISSVMDAFGLLARVQDRELKGLPSKQVLEGISHNTLIPSAVVFHVEFVGQSLVEDLKELPGQRIDGTSLATMLRIGQSPTPKPESKNNDLRYFVAESDPSQENAVSQAFHEKGIVVQGPPGTGKSQTIVNLVSDAIGRKKSVLVVCQKLPALEVVRKRLHANGLHDRICMVTDVNRDRNTIIKEIREQVSEISNSNLFRVQDAQNRRDNLLETIKALEADLNKVHETGQKSDSRFRRSYLSIVDELLTIDQDCGNGLPEANGLCRVLKDLTIEEIVALEETCADVALLWLNSNFENSPFWVLSNFSFDDGSISEIGSGLLKLYEAEQSRSKIISEALDAIEVIKVEKAEEWMCNHESFFTKLTTEERNGYLKDVDCFLIGTNGSQLIRVVQGLLELHQSKPDCCYEVSELRDRLKYCSEDRLKQNASFCSENINLWISSRFVGNPFSKLKQQAFDKHGLADIIKCLNELENAEDYRVRILQEPFKGKDLENVTSLNLWIEQHSEILKSIDQEGALKVGSLYSLFEEKSANRSNGGQLLRQAKKYLEALGKLDLTGYSEAIGRIVQGIPLSEIHIWFKTAPYLKPDTNVFDMLNPVRFLAIRKAKKFLTASSLAPVSENLVALGIALTLEEMILTIRRDWKSPSEILGESNSKSLSITELKDEIESSVKDLEFVQKVVTALNSYPGKIQKDVTRLSKQSSFRNLVAMTDLLVRRHQARMISLNVIEKLSSWMSEDWCRQAEEYVKTMIVSDQGLVIKNLLDYRETVESYFEIKRRFKEPGKDLESLFASLSSVCEHIEGKASTIPAREYVGTIVIYNGLKEQLVQVSRKVPGLLPELPDSFSSLKIAFNRLCRIRDLADRILSCPCQDDRRMMLLTSAESSIEFFRQLRNGILREIARKRSEEVVKEFSKWITEEWMTAFISAVRSNSVDISQTTALQIALPTLKNYLLFRQRWFKFGPILQQCFGEFAKYRQFLSNVSSNKVGPLIKTLIQRSALLAWKTKMEQEQPQLLIQRAELDRKIDSLNKSLIELREIDRSLLTSNFDRGAVRPEREWEGITRLRGVRAISLRQFFERGEQLGLRSLRPVWMMIPDVVSQVLPRVPGLFDIVIFDEASQMPVEHALPSLFRGATVVVSGDEKQMPPSSFFSGRIESDEPEEDEDESLSNQITDQERDAKEEAWNRRDIKDCPDLLNLAESILPRTMLQIHYRSKFRELISFSNSAFYRNELSIPVVHPEQTVLREKPIEFISVKGTYTKQTNEAEAQRVVAYLESIWKTSRKSCPSIGIVTFNRKQADLIEDMLEQRAEKNAKFRDALIRERDRTDNGEDMSLFVKNVENVQGDERDVIIFSTTFGRDPQGIFRRNFGILGQNGGERRLNVAITRARLKVALITSMPIPDVSDMLNLQRVPSSPRDYLQGYLEFARLTSEGKFDDSRRLVGRMATERRSGAESVPALVGLRRSVYEFVKSLGYTISRPEPDPVLGLDFAIYDPKTELFGVGIECSPPNHRLLTSARMREIWRPSLIGTKYRKFIRISSSEWFRNRELEQQRLASEIRSVIGVGQ